MVVRRRRRRARRLRLPVRPLPLRLRPDPRAVLMTWMTIFRSDTRFWLIF
jgi:hypothetical protein